jgi:hypothetical protein
MKNPFEHYDIHHLSPSSCNLFVASPAMFILQKLMKVKNPVGPAAHRGTSVESGIVAGLVDGLSEAECVNVARSQFASLTALMSGPKKEKEEAAIADFGDDQRHEVGIRLDGERFLIPLNESQMAGASDGDAVELAHRPGFGDNLPVAFHLLGPVGDVNTSGQAQRKERYRGKNRCFHIL